MQIELIEQAFAPGEISEIWITFPDPQIKFKRTKHRLTNPVFLSKYKNILKENGLIHLKTDSEFLHGYTIGLLQGLGYEILYAHHDVYINTYAPEEVVNIQTFYEKQFLEKGKAITYLKFKLQP
jgi:tRNA (guanine-N7-)-methyltransferase